ncbi:MAG: hypothetical protein ACK501_16005 [Planctomycetota bacterium]|jgi:hypothetical protein
MAAVEPRGRQRTPRLVRAVLAAVAALAGACRSAPYAACPVPLTAPLPADAFERCQQVLLQQGGGLVTADASPLRLQTGWAAVDDPPGERRCSVFVDDAVDPPGLAVVVELRWLRESWFGIPGWSEPRGDDAAERALAEALAKALAAER